MKVNRQFSKQKSAKKSAIKRSEIKRLNLWLKIWILSSLFVKIVIIMNLEAGAWLGADGESYITGANSLLKDGFYSKDSILQYWPAGYPLFIALVAKVMINLALPIISLLQSLFFCYATWRLLQSLKSTPLCSILPWLSFFLSYSPTLSLASLSIGYESPVASSLMLLVALLVGSKVHGDTSRHYFYRFGAISSFIAFFQPRYLLVSIIFLCIWIFTSPKKKSLFIPASVCLVLTLMLPALLVVRNYFATGNAVISTNLGITMNIGAGKNATGGYMNSGSGVECDPPAESDSQRVKCIASWYLSNPNETVRLAWNKSLFFWSPWYGPSANGTMARNPWLKINPFVELSETDYWRKIIFGDFGKFVSTLWTLSGLLLIFLGLASTWRYGVLGRNLVWILVVPILVSWIVAIGTIGDHRFRLPIMSTVIALQLKGISQLRNWRRMRDLNPR